MNVFEAVRESGITARQAAERCGVKVNRNSMAVCPFHKDKQAQDITRWRLSKICSMIFTRGIYPRKSAAQ